MSSKDKQRKPKDSKAQQSPERLRKLRDMLENKRRELLERAGERAQVMEIDAHGDLVDQSTDLSERELRMRMAEKDRRELSDIDEALRRMEEGTYGVCEATGKEIPIERLRAVPTARYCVEAQEQLDAMSQGDEDFDGEFPDVYAAEDDRR